MSSDAWIYQKGEQVEKLGAEAASWYVGWYEPDGRRKGQSFGPGFHGKKKAEAFKRKVESELMTGTYQMQTRKLWADFRAEYERRVLEGLAVRTRLQARISLDHFERIIKPIRVFPINTQHIDDFIAARRLEAGRKEGDVVSPATVNKDLRHIRAALDVAQEWGYLKDVPKFRMERTPRKLPRYVTGEHFALIYQACDQAGLPDDLPNMSAADWWRGLIVMAYMTGWRISELLALDRADLDLEAGFAITRHEDNKGKRDERVKLHPAVVEHLRRLAGFGPVVFPWNRSEQKLYVQFAKIQEAATIKLHCPGNHTHTRFCHVYGFHDLRRAFATMNAGKLSPDALQVLMRHKSYETTKRYINMARQMDEAVASLHVPEVLRATGG
jgi:integrase